MNLEPFLATPPPVWLVLPFGVLLVAIALMPFVARHWWERWYPGVSVVLGASVAAYYVAVLGAGGRVVHVLHEYVSFLALVGSLFVIAGGIHLRPRGEATPLANCAWLLSGAVLANVLGTTGASMLLIRPFIRVNRVRMTGFHVVFFIFLVGNVGGCLTPIGDPPLFLGYLKGVPFGWVFTHCWPAWILAVGMLLAIFYVLDAINFRRVRAVAEPSSAGDGWHLDGLHNVAFLALALGAVFVSEPTGLREGLMVLAAVGSWLTTPRRVHEANEFLFHPIQEVAWLFAGIFLTMLPVLDLLGAHPDALGLDRDLKFYAYTGGLSGVLDNAPTYLAFLAAALGKAGLTMDNPADVAAFAADPAGARTLLAISLGAVFWGAATYLGNAPNFMVKSIAEHAGRKVPGFVPYVWRYALPILGPVLGVVGWVFFC